MRLVSHDAAALMTASQDASGVAGESVDALRALLERLSADNAHLRAELEQWKREAERLAQALERIKDQQQTPREHVDPNQIQLAFEQIAADLLKLVKPEQDQAQAPAGTGQADSEGGQKKKRNIRPHGRSPLPEHLPVETLTIVPKNLPDDAKKVNEDVSWKLGFRRASFYRLKIVRPRYAVAVDAQVDCDEVEVTLVRGDEAQASAAAAPGTVEAPVSDAATDTAMHLADTRVLDEAAGDGAQARAGGDAPAVVDTTIVQASAPVELIARGMPTADLLAYILLGKFADKLPFNRQTGMFQREGVSISRGTMCQWAQQVHPFVAPLVAAMADDARNNADVICTDATGVLVQAKHKCKNGTFWVYVADNGHVIFRYAKDASGAEPKKFFAGYKAIIVADATSTLDAICNADDGPADRGGCMSHARRYFYKAVETDRDLALVGLGLVNRIFEIERECEGLPPSRRLEVRQQKAGPVFLALVQWCSQQNLVADSKSRIHRALFYVVNNAHDLGCFLRDGRAPLTNNISERELRRLVIGRANWLFIGHDDSAPWTADLTSLVGSCALHGLDPAAYLRDIFRVLPHWPKRRLLELCPRDWPATRARLDPAELALPLGPLTVPPAS
jgi:transposase